VVLSIKAETMPKSQRTFHFFGGFAWYTMSINHRRSYIDKAQHCLDRPNIITRL